MRLSRYLLPVLTVLALSLGLVGCGESNPQPTNMNSPGSMAQPKGKEGKPGPPAPPPVPKIN